MTNIFVGLMPRPRSLITPFLGRRIRVRIEHWRRRFQEARCCPHPDNAAEYFFYHARGMFFLLSMILAIGGCSRHFLLCRKTGSLRGQQAAFERGCVCCPQCSVDLSANLGQAPNYREKVTLKARKIESREGRIINHHHLSTLQQAGLEAGPSGESWQESGEAVLVPSVSSSNRRPHQEEQDMLQGPAGEHFGPISVMDLLKAMSLLAYVEE